MVRNIESIGSIVGSTNKLSFRGIKSHGGGKGVISKGRFSFDRKVREGLAGEKYRSLRRFKAPETKHLFSIPTVRKNKRKANKRAATA